MQLLEFVGGLSFGMAVLVFLLGAVAVGGAGVTLVRSGDDLAERRGWSRFWVGSMLIAVGTSLPELVTNISAVRIDAPGLAIGNVFGADMADVMILGLMAAFYGRRKFFAELSPGTKDLTILAMTLVASALVLGAVSWGASIGSLGLSGAFLIALYLAGAWWLSRSRGGESEAEASQDGPSVAVGSEKRVWALFLGSAAAIVLAAPIATASAERIAELTGLNSGFVGIALLAIVTTLPEAVTSVAALRLGSPDLVVGNLLGSCAFNVLVLGAADPFYTNGLLLNTMEGPHFAAGVTALLLIGMVWGRMLMGGRWPNQHAPVFPILVAIVYAAGLVAAFILGS